eukprot:UN25516
MTNSTSFLIVRFGIGIMSAGFVPCQSWNPLVWSPREVGFVNGMSAGIGNFGAGVAAYCSTTIGEATSWRTALGITVVLTFLIMIALVFAPTPPKPQPAAICGYSFWMGKLQTCHVVLFHLDSYVELRYLLWSRTLCV